jgi:hypothetical protein
MYSAENQAGIPLLSRLHLHMRKLAQAIDSRVGPEVDAATFKADRRLRLETACPVQPVGTVLSFV